MVSSTVSITVDRWQINLFEVFNVCLDHSLLKPPTKSFRYAIKFDRCTVLKTDGLGVICLRFRFISVS